MRSFPILLFLFTFPTAGHAQTANPIYEVSESYLQAEMNLDWDAIRNLYAESVQFQDPTGEVFNGPLSGKMIRGRDSLISVQKGWGMTGSEFDVDAAFFVARFAVHRGTYHVGFEGMEERVHIPFVTVHEIVDGHLVARTDFGEYVKSFGLGDGFDDTMDSTRAVADRYLQAYLDVDLDVQRELLSPEVRFRDATATVFGPGSGMPVEGAERLLARRAATFQSISDFGLDIEHSFVSGHHAIFMGKTRYTTAAGQSNRQPAVFIVEVRGGKVTRHWNFVDYTVARSDRSIRNQPPERVRSPENPDS